MMVTQYDNGYSPDSVAVQTLSGTLLGYVPRRHNHRFIHDVNFGHVYAVGQDAAGLWRLTVGQILMLCVLGGWGRGAAGGGRGLARTVGQNAAGL